MKKILLGFALLASLSMTAVTNSIVKRTARNTIKQLEYNTYANFEKTIQVKGTLSCIENYCDFIGSEITTSYFRTTM